MDIFFNHSLLRFLINESKFKIQKTAKIKDLKYFIKLEKSL